MADATLSLQRVFGRSGIQQLAGPILILLILSMMVLPLPPFLLDLFFTFNIAISIVVMLVAINVLKPGGAFVAKAFQGGETADVIAELKRHFNDVRNIKPKASRADSSEVYLVATGFKGV